MSTNPYQLVRLRGEYDGFRKSELEREFDALDWRRDVIVDLSETTFFDTVALGVLVFAQRLRTTLGGGPITLLRPTALTLRLIEISGLQSIFRVVQS
jgi:anti-anti-sigma factor